MEGLNETENSENVIQNKIEAIKEILDVTYSDEERKKFNEWKKQIPENSVENPININDELGVLSFLPDVPNADNEDIKIFFLINSPLTDSKLNELFHKFSITNPNFEIGLTVYSENLFSISIGNKENHRINVEGEDYGHYHPTYYLEKIENKDGLPTLFLDGILPSRGDMKGWEKLFQTGQKTTRIFSNHGYTEITAPDDFRGFSAEKIQAFADVYFDLFLGENELNLKSDEEIISYFQDNFNLSLVVHRYKETETTE